MASPNKTKLPEQQISHSDPATSPSSAPAEFPSAEITEDQAQEEKMAVLMTTVTLASGADDHHSEKAQGEPNQLAVGTAVTGIADGGVDSQQQSATEAAANVPVSETRTAPSEVASDEGGDLGSDDEGMDMAFEDGFEPNFDDFDPNKEEEVDDFDKSLEPMFPTSEINPNDGLENATAPGYASERDHESQEGCPSNTENGQETSIANDLGNYGDIPRIVDGREIFDYAETVSEAGAWDDEEGHIAEATRDSEADQATPDQAVSASSASPAEPVHGGGEDIGSVPGPAAVLDHDEAMTAAPPGSDIGDGDNHGSTIHASTSFDRGGGGNRGSMIPASVGSGYEHEEHSGPATPALTFSQYSEEDNEPVTPTSASVGYEYEEHGSPVEGTPAGSDHGNEENRDSMTATFATPDDGNGESSGSMAPASADSDHGNADGNSSEAATPAGVDHADEGNNNSASGSTIASQEDNSAPNREDKDKMKEVRDEEAPGDSGSPTEATPSDTIDEGEVPDSTATPTRDAEEAASQAGEETDHEYEVVDLRPPEMPDPPVQPTQPLGEDALDYDLEEGEETRNPVDRVSILTGYRRLGARALSAEEEEEGRTAKALSKQGDDGKGDGDAADTALGANTDDNTDDHSGESSGDADSHENDLGATQDLVVRTGNEDSDTVYLKIEYRVQYSTRAKATMCISVPATITLAALQSTIWNAARQHGDFKNPHPIHKKSKIARLVVVFAEKKSKEPNFCRTRELTEENLEETLRLMPKRSIYDVVKVQFKPGTNGEATPKKATGKIYGKSWKVGGL